MYYSVRYMYLTSAESGKAESRSSTDQPRVPVNQKSLDLLAHQPPNEEKHADGQKG